MDATQPDVRTLPDPVVPEQPKKLRGFQMRKNSGNREAERDLLSGTLAAGIKAAMDDAGFRRYLDVQARFHRYSPSNVWLIASQCPTATHVAGYRAWQALGRQVRKGEKGIRIFVPFTRKREENEEEGTRKVTGFGVGTVFDVAQTDGEPLPEPPVAMLEGDVNRALREAVEGWVQDEGLALKRIPGLRENGYYSPLAQEIGIKAELPDRHAFKTLVHEAAHHVARHSGESDAAERETVAECAAYVTLKHFGIDSGDYSFGYVAAWARSEEIFKAHANQAAAVARRLIDAIETKLIAAAALDGAAAA
jgi:antirestriction protein ArdC